MAPVSDHAHAQRGSDLCHGPANAAQANDAHRLPREFHQRIAPEAEIRALRPFALAHQATVLAHVQAQLQQQRDGHLRHGIGAVSGHIAHGNAPLPRRFHIHNVHTRGQHADKAQLLRGLDRLPVEHHLVGVDDGRAGDARGDLLGPRAVVHR